MMSIDEPRKKQNGRPQSSKQRSRNKQRPPVMQAAHKAATPGCARLLRRSFLDRSTLFYQFVRQRNLGMISHRSLLACVVVVIAALSTSSFAQKPTAQPAVIPFPKSVLGFTPGEDRTIADWSQITGYFEQLDRASDRVLVQNLGQSTLKRPLIVAFISARENILALPKYKEIQQQLADPRKVTQNLQRDRLLANGKTVVTISCSIHSTEIVASQMSMQLAYELPTAQDADTRAILQNTILLLIPSPNPDGIDIVANWYRKTLGTPFEGREPPELYHHYAGHDDNRDWFMLNLKETQLITRLLWHEW